APLHVGDDGGPRAPDRFALSLRRGLGRGRLRRGRGGGSRGWRGRRRSGAGAAIAGRAPVIGEELLPVRTHRRRIRPEPLVHLFDEPRVRAELLPVYVL